MFILQIKAIHVIKQMSLDKKTYLRLFYCICRCCLETGGDFLIDLFLSQQAVDSNRILYTSSSFAKNFLIYLQETGQLNAIAQIGRAYNLFCVLLYWMEQGSCIMIIVNIGRCYGCIWNTRCRCDGLL